MRTSDFERCLQSVLMVTDFMTVTSVFLSWYLYVFHSYCHHVLVFVRVVERLKIAVFWDRTPRSLVDGCDRRYEEPDVSCLIHCSILRLTYVPVSCNTGWFIYKETQMFRNRLRGRSQHGVSLTFFPVFHLCLSSKTVGSRKKHTDVRWIGHDAATTWPWRPCGK